jgi:hypothetical protein
VAIVPKEVAFVIEDSVVDEHLVWTIFFACQKVKKKIITNLKLVKKREAWKYNACGI